MGAPTLTDAFYMWLSVWPLTLVLVVLIAAVVCLVIQRRNLISQGKWMACVGLVGLLGACTTLSPAPHSTQAQIYKDEVECRALAEQGAGPPGVIFREWLKSEALAKCLKSRDWAEKGAQP